MIGAEQTFDAVAGAAQVWVTFVLFALGVQFALYWLRIRRRLEAMRGSALIDPPDLKESKFAALLASGLFGGTVVSFGVVVAEAFWGRNDLVVTLASYGCFLTGFYFLWRLSFRVEEKLRLSHRPRYEPLRRLRLPALLHHSRYVYVVLAVPLLYFALACPATDPRADLSVWGFAYRWTSAGPGLVVSLFVAALFAEAARNNVGGELKATRWRAATWGALGFAALWANHLLWPYVGLYFPECWAGRNFVGLQRLLEAPIFGFLGVAFFRAFTREFRSGAADKTLERTISFRRLSERVSFVLSGWAVFSQKLTEDYYEASSLLEKTLARLEVGPNERQLAADALALRSARQGGVLNETDLRRLHLHHSLEARAGDRGDRGRRRAPSRPIPSRRPGGASRPTRRRLGALGRALREGAERLSRPTYLHVGAPLAGLNGGAPAPTPAYRQNPRRSNLLARAAGAVVALPQAGDVPDLPGRPSWQQAYVVVAAMSGLLPCPHASREVLDPRGKNHALRTQRVAYQALLDLAGDGDLLRHTKAYGVLADLFGERHVDPVISSATRGLEDHQPGA